MTRSPTKMESDGTDENAADAEESVPMVSCPLCGEWVDLDDMDGQLVMLAHVDARRQPRKAWAADGATYVRVRIRCEGSGSIVDIIPHPAKEDRP